MSLYDIDPGSDTPEIVRMIVEIPKNSSNKYEYDGKLGVFRLDRALYSPLHYPPTNCARWNTSSPSTRNWKASGPR